MRFFIVRAHYRSPLNYSDQHLEDARQGLARLYTALKNAPLDAGTPDWDMPYAKRFRDAMDDDFNTPEAVAALFDLANEANRTGSAALTRQLRALGGILGLLGRDSDEFLKRVPPSAESGAIAAAEIEALIVARREARAGKNFARADEIRAELLAKGIVLEDGPKGTTWRRA